MRHPLLVLGIFMVMHASAQQAPTPTAKNPGPLSLTITGALLPLPEFNAGIQPGIRFHFNERYSLLSEVCFRVGNSANKDSEAVNKKYIRIQEELRIQLPGTSRHKKYVGVRLAAANRRFDDINGGFYALDKRKAQQGVFYDRASINSPVFSLSAQGGMVFAFSKQLGLDVFAGIGARYIKTRYTDVVNPRPGNRPPDPDGSAVYASYSFDGTMIGLQLNAGLRLCWRFPG